MKTSRLTLFFTAVAIPILVSACTYQQSTEFLTPTAPTLPAGPAPPNGSVGSLAGIWAAEADLASAESWSCTGLQWNVTEQTATTIGGTFTGICREFVLISGSASGQLTSSDVTIRATGTASLQDDVVTCPFTLNGVGNIMGSHEMRVEYEGSTCFGPVSGEETLRRPPGSAVAQTGAPD